MRKNELKLSDFQKNKENPFLNQALECIDKNIVKKYKSSTSTDQKASLLAVDPNTSEVLGFTRFIRQIEVDEEKFAKLYLSNFAAFFDLSQAAIRVFGYILTCLKPKNDMIIFILEDCLQYTKYTSKATIYKALAELVKAEIIARGPADNLLYINPLIVFNGDRVTFAKTFVKKKKKSQPEIKDNRMLELPFDETDIVQPSE